MTVEYLLCDQVKKLHLTEEGVVDWLLDSDVHLIITHVHQNIVEHLGWNMDVLMYQLQKLNSHPGYPYRQLLRDPIFLQDKYDYIHYMYTLVDALQSSCLNDHRLTERVRYLILNTN